MVGTMVLVLMGYGSAVVWNGFGCECCKKADK